LQIEFENLSNENFISSFGKDFIIIKNKKYFKNLILIDTLIDVNVGSNSIFAEDLVRKKIEIISKNRIDFILFGMGKQIGRLPIKTIKLLIKKKIPYEIMTSVSAFKTYNILLSQGRRTLAFLKLET
tara:strand:+ start:178 stop:558 length:381 start_codon:yes stop_codon:yes gene_type:complete